MNAKVKSGVKTMMNENKLLNEIGKLRTSACSLKHWRDQD